LGTGGGRVRLLFRLIGWLFILFALAVLGLGAWYWSATGEFHLFATGELWYRLDPGSLNLMQAVTQRYVSPWLWDQVVTPVLLQPAALVLALVGFVLLFLTRRRDRRRRGNVFS
jgi:hypothetical protein